MTSTRSTTTRRLVLVGTAVAAFGLTAPVQPAAAQPLPTGAGIVRAAHHDGVGDCAKKVRRLTERYKQLGMSGHAAHAAAELTLHC